MDLFSKAIMGMILAYCAFVLIASSNGGGGISTDNSASYSSGNGGFFSFLFGSKKTVFFSRDVGTLGTVKPARRIFNLGGEEGIKLTSEDIQERKTIKEIKEEITIKNNLLSEQTRKISFVTPAKYKDIFIEFDLNAKYHSMGDLTISVNNNTAYSSKKGGPVSFSIPIEYMNLTNTHEIEISAGKSENIIGKTEYVIENFRISAQKDTIEKTFPIPLENYEIDGWNVGVLDFVVEDAVRNSPLQVIINNNIIYSQKPLPLEKYEETFSNLEAQMMPKENIVIFSTNKDSGYILNNVHLSVKYYDTDTVSNKKYSFYLHESDIKL
ncbi:MAG: hypothetical protein KAQ92_02385, partial [Candidatus Aenigmarchaeota archaeon]|nr:hypothetical protein [Candidatus Aenigmarchaeota archaeon]